MKIKPLLSSALFLMCTSAPWAATAEPNVGDRFGEWNFECTARSATNIDCGFAQLILRQDNGEPIARLRFTGAKDDLPGRLTALLPLGVEVPSGVEARIDDTVDLPLELYACLAQGCIFQGDITEDIDDALRGGVQLSLSFTLVGTNQRATIRSSLTGLGDAFDAAGW